MLLQIKYQPADVYKSVVYIKACGIALQSSKHEETTLPHNFIFVFIPCLIGAILSKKNNAKSGAFRKKDIKGE